MKQISKFEKIFIKHHCLWHVYMPKKAMES